MLSVPPSHELCGPEPFPQELENQCENRKLTPVFIKQLEVDAQCDGQSATLDNKPLRQIKIMGVIVEVKESSTNVQYTVEDSTGRINCKKWIDDNTDDPWRQKERDALKEGVYVKVFGQLREFQGHKNINAFEVYPVVDFNEVTFHMLETLHVHLVNTHGEKHVPPHPLNILKCIYNGVF